MKKKTDIKPYLRCLFYKNKLPLLCYCIQTLLATASALLISWLLQQIIDLLGGYETGFTLSQLIVLALFAGVLFLGAATIEYFTKPKFISRASTQYKNFVFSKLTQKGIAAFGKEGTAGHISVLSNDVASIENGLLSNLFVILNQTVLLMGALALMLFYDPLLTGISLALALVPLLTAVLTGGLTERAEKQVSNKNEGYMSMLRDCFTGFAVIKAFRAEGQMCRLFGRSVKELDDSKEHRRKMTVLVSSCANMAGFILQLGIFLFGAYLALSGRAISAGSVLVFLQLLNYIINPIATVPAAIGECRASLALIEKAAFSIESNVRTEGKIQALLPHSDIVLRSLSFAYESEKPILTDLNFCFEAGKSYCIVGASGSGKTTLLNLLTGAYNTYGGSICYGGVELRDIHSEALYSFVSMILQNVFIFNASVRDNITMFSDFSREEVDRAIRLSGLAEFIAANGEEYLCGENGSALSGGERQRIAIARGLLKNAQVLLADEATSALDSETAAQVNDAILSLDGMTRIVVTHRMEAGVLKRFDRILALQNGTLAECGTFDTLMQQRGYFYSLFTVSQEKGRYL